MWCGYRNSMMCLVIITVAMGRDQLVEGGESVKLVGALVFVGPNDPLPWTEMDFNRAPPLAPEPYYSREETRCFEDRKVYYEGKCWNLLQRGPCQDGEWLVLDPSCQGVRPICTDRLCPSDKAFWQPTGKCVPLTDTSKCNKKETSLQVDSLGYGACKCMHGAARAMASNGVCYKLYTRGFCDKGFVVAMDTEAEDYPATCVPDICNSTSSHQILLPYKGSCYRDGSHDPCPEDQALSVDVHSGKPTCAVELLTWHIVSVPPRCPLVDHNGDCRDKLTLKLETDNYINDLKSDKSKHRNRFGVSKG